MKKEKYYFLKIILFTTFIAMVVFFTPIKALATETTIAASFDSKTGIISCDLSGGNVYGLYVSRDGIHFGQAVSISQSGHYDYHVTEIINHYYEKNGTYVFQFYGFSSNEDIYNVNNAIVKSEAFTFNYTIPEGMVSTPLISEMKLYQPRGRSKYIEIKWNPCENANDYALFWTKDSKEYYHVYDYKNATGYGYPENMDIGHVYKVQVKAFSKDILKYKDSDYSIPSYEITIDSEGNVYFDGVIVYPEKTNTPSISNVNYLERSNGNRILEIKWNSVENVLYYQLEKYVDGILDDSHYVENIFYLINDSLEIGHSYTFRVKAISNNIEIMDSDYSDYSDEITIDSEGNVYYGDVLLPVEKAKPEQDTIVTYDANGGTTGKYWIDSYETSYEEIVDSILIDNDWISSWIWEDTILPPEGMTFDGLAYNDVEYHVGETIPEYVMTGPLTIKYLWKTSNCCYEYIDGVLTLKGNIDAFDIKQFNKKDQVKSILAEEGTVFPEDCSNLFAGYINCSTIDFSKVDTSKVKNMSNMFAGLNLKKIDLSGFDMKNVNNAEYMFFSEFFIDEITLGDSFTQIDESMHLLNGYFGWAKGNIDSVCVSSGNRDCAVISNIGENTYYKKHYEFNNSPIVLILWDNNRQEAKDLVCGMDLEVYVSANSQVMQFQWMRDDEPITGETNKNYRITKEDLGHKINCQVTDSTGELTGSCVVSATGNQMVDKNRPDLTSKELAELWKTEPCSKKGTSDGIIHNISDAVEIATKPDFSDSFRPNYKEGNWTYSETGASWANFKAGTYYLRIAETDYCYASETVVVVVEDGPEENQKTQEELVSDFVKRFYTIILQRDQVNDVEIEYYTSRLLSHEIDGCTVARGFVMSPEYTDKNEPNEIFVDKMYAAFFNREADDAAFYINLLEAGYSREIVLAGFVNSPEFKNLCAEYGINPGELVVEPENPDPENNQGNGENNQGNNPSDDVTKLNLDTSNVDPEKLDEYVKNLYLKILGRQYDEGGLEYWKENIMSGEVYDAATAARVGFFESPEYQEKNKTNEEFVIDCYHAFLGRDPEPEGLAYWTEKLDSGEYSKQKVIDLGFGHSEEFKNILRDCGFGIIE